MKKWFVAAGAALAVTAAGIGGGVASAKAPTTFAQVLSVKQTSPTTADVRMTYRCTTADHTSPHSFASIKQVGSAKADPALRQSGSSQLAIETGGAWAMQHQNAVNCDSKVHVQSFHVNQEETQSFGVPLRTFRTGWVWVQFCIFDDNYPIPAPPADPESGVPYDAHTFRFMT